LQLPKEASTDSLVEMILKDKAHVQGTYLNFLPLRWDPKSSSIGIRADQKATGTCKCCGLIKASQDLKLE
jgi:hypothetical protein